MTNHSCQIIGRRVAPLACAFGIIFFISGCASSKTGSDTKTPGVEYRQQALTEPRPNQVHVLRVDLANNKIQPAVVVAADPDGNGPAEAALTNPLKLAGNESVIAFVNTNPWEGLPDADGKINRNWFEGQPVKIQGLAVAGGRVRSPARSNGASVWIDERRHVFFGDGPGEKPAAEGMGGFQRIIEDGAVTAPGGTALHPRTAIGTDRTGTILWLVVVDGRQPQYSEGMTLLELGDVMRKLGCWNATNLDGGGSSIMGLAGADGQLRIINSPSGRRLGFPDIRPVPTIFTIRQMLPAGNI